MPVLLSTANEFDAAYMGIERDSFADAKHVMADARTPVSIIFSGPDGEVELVGPEAFHFIVTAYDWLYEQDPDWFTRSRRVKSKLPPGVD